MIQEILTYIIISLSVFHVLRSLYKMIKPSAKKGKGVCGYSCQGCAMSKNYNRKTQIKVLRIK